MIDWKKVQARLGAVADGDAGPLTYAALLARVAGKAVPLGRELGAGLAVHVPIYQVDTVDRLSAFLGQTAVESGGFAWMEEMGGPRYFARYDGRGDLGNTQPGDGARFHGRGLIQLTGRANYRDFGQALGLDLIAHPEIAAQPTTAVLLALEFWKRKRLNSLADFDDMEAITKRINGGMNGFEERMRYWARARAVLA